MNRAIAARIGNSVGKFVAARIVWLAWLFGVACGSWLITAWAYTLAFATPQAIALLGWVRG